MLSAGTRLKQALVHENPLQVVGAINAYTALQAQAAGFHALYLSGAGVANAAYGLPDLGLTTLAQVQEETRRITQTTSLPLIVDADTGFDDVAQCVVALSAAGAAGLHIEDQTNPKRCGHRKGKQVVSTQEMVSKVSVAVSAKPYKDFIIIARTDAVGVEGLSAAIERAKAYVAAGADWIFAEAITSLQDYQAFTAALSAPVLANITEFGQTPLFTRAALAQSGVQVILYPLSAFRAMSHAAKQVYTTIREQGTQASLIQNMQTRDELYALLHYEEQERRLGGKHDLDTTI